MRVLITGGAGYVGNQLTRELLDDGNIVTIIDRFTYGYEPIMHLAANPHLTIEPGDIRGITRAQARGFDAVYHLAAISGYAQCEAAPGEAVAVNVGGTQAIVDAMEPSQLLIYASTTSVYGPQTLYARTKHEAETIAMQRANSISVRWATLFGVGPRMRHELLPNAFTRQAVQAGHIDLYSPDQRRTFMHVADAALDYVALLDAPSQYVGQVWDVGDSGLTCNKAELVARIQEEVPCDVTIMDEPDADARDLDVDFTRAEAVGLGCRTDWCRSITELARFYRACWQEDGQ